jgi:hypothetical protein
MTQGAITPWSDSTRLTVANNKRWNGILEVNVINPLVSPGVDSDISINVYVSAHEDLKLGAPNGSNFTNLSVFPKLAPQSGYRPQSGEQPELDLALSDNANKPNSTKVLTPIAPMSTTRDQQYEVFFGEAPTSLRELFRRYVQTKSYEFTAATSGNYKIIRLQQQALSPFYGYDPNGQDIVGGNPATICGVTPLTYMMPCYAGWRGGLRRKFMLDGPSMRNPQAARCGFLANVVSESLVTDNATSVSNWNTRILCTHGFSGSQVTDKNNNNCIEVEVPYYNGVRMSPCRLPSDDFRNGAESVRLTTGLPYSTAAVPYNQRITITQYDSVGEDFSLFFFTGCPILYEYAIENDF